VWGWFTEIIIREPVIIISFISAVQPYPTSLTITPHCVWEHGQLRPGHAIIALQ